MAMTREAKNSRPSSGNHKAHSNSTSAKSHSNGRAELREQAAIVKQDMHDLATAAGAAATEQLDPLQEYIREKPLKSMLLAAGVGAVLGAFFLRR